MDGVIDRRSGRFLPPIEALFDNFANRIRRRRHRGRHHHRRGAKWMEIHGSRLGDGLTSLLLRSDEQENKKLCWWSATEEEEPALEQNEWRVKCVCVLSINHSFIHLCGKFHSNAIWEVLGSMGFWFGGRIVRNMAKIDRSGIHFALNDNLPHWLPPIHSVPICPFHSL